MSESSREPVITEHCSSEVLQRVGVAETDMMGVVHHGSYIAYLERGRLEYMRRRGLPYKALVERGYHLPVVELNLRYKKPARFDDLLQIETRLGAVTKVTVRFDYCVRCPAPAGAGVALDVLLEAHVVLACIDTSGKPRAVPQDALLALRSAEQVPSCAHSW